MKVKDVFALLDDCTQLYICDETGVVIVDISWQWHDIASELLDANVINITTYNYGIEVDVDIETE